MSVMVIPKETIFELSLWTFEKQKRRRKDDYQNFSLNVGRRAFFRTVAEAESRIPEWVKEEEPRNIYSFRLVEYPIGLTLLTTHENLSERIYDQAGYKLDERLYPTVGLTADWQSAYRGRTQDKIIYKPGDVVEFAGDLFVIECFMTPRAQKEWTMADETDDGYIALRVDENADEIRFDDHGYVILDDQNPQCTDIFPPHFDFSAKIQRRIANLRNYVLIRACSNRVNSIKHINVKNYTKV